MKHYTLTTFGCAEYLCRVGLIPGELETRPAPIRHRRYRIADIQRTVAERFKIPSAEMVSNRRSRVVARPRQIAMYLARELTVSSLPEIGRRFGGRDHTTVIHAIRQIEKLRAIDGDLNADVAALQISLEAA